MEAAMALSKITFLGIPQWHLTFGFCGIVFSILFAVLSVPSPTLLKFKSSGSVGDHSPTPHLTAILSCMMWVLYSYPFVQSGNILFAIGNAAVGFIGFIYLLLFAIYSKSWSDKRRMIITTFLLELIFVVIYAPTVLTVAHEPKLRHHVIGIVSMICQIGTYVAPISALKLAIKTHDVENMGGFFAISMSASYYSLWLAYALIPFDLYLLIPNILGFIMAKIQLRLYMKWRKTPAAEELPQWLLNRIVNQFNIYFC